MSWIASRLLLRLALVCASLAWASLVFTNTIGDPGRGERIAQAVLDDDEARAEITAPITAAVVQATGLPDGQETAVAIVVDEILRDPAGARAFVDPFAGSWARLLGEDDPRPAVFDLAPILADIEELLTPLGVETDLTGQLPDGTALEVPAVPLPRAQLGWMADVRRVVASATIPLAVVAAGLALVAFAAGDRRRVVRRAGIWAIIAGATWVVIPPLVVWAARRWASGADAVVATTLDEATASMRIVSWAMVLGGAAFVAGAVLVPAGPAAAGEPRRRRRRGAEATYEPATDPYVEPSGHRPPPAGSHAGPPRPAPAAATRVMPTTPPSSSGPPSGDEHPNRPPVYEPTPTGTPIFIGSTVAADTTVSLTDPTIAPGPSRSADASADAGTEPDSDALWDFYR